jgi:hypothetical protein
MPVGVAAVFEHDCLVGMMSGIYKSIHAACLILP